MSKEEKVGSSSSYDEYGFEKPADFDPSVHDAFMSEYLPVLVRRSRRWEDLMAQYHQTNPDFLISSKGSRKVKRFVRKGIPGDRRGQVWMFLSGAEEMKRSNCGEFRKMLQTSINGEFVDQIETDLNRTFPNNVFFSREDPQCLQKSLFNVLVAFGNKNPHIGYCQGLNYVAGLLLIVTRSEEMSYFLLRALTERLLPEYYDSSILGLRTDVRVFAELIRIKCPEVFSKVESLRMPWELICSKWFVCLYSDVLPIETVLRVWDCLFHEGSKILLRVAVALVVKNKKSLCEAKDFSCLVDRFRDCAVDETAVNCHEFISNVFEISSPMANKTLEKLRFDFGLQIRKEQNERDQRKKLLREKESTTISKQI